MTETFRLPIRVPQNQAPAATFQTWRCRDRGLLQRTLDGLRALDLPVRCRADATPINSYAHAHQIAAAHADHGRCPRYTAALAYAQEVRP
ncbi:hypothetical protein [Nocardia carnea]|uniref:hypothetical protein n=1 Tax=Nocardia carnea TaxID=37328 RepID=UPI002454BBAD|nr:hypothetical protein [Nocardia carnea]